MCCPLSLCSALLCLDLISISLTPHLCVAGEPDFDALDKLDRLAVYEEYIRCGTALLYCSIALHGVL